MVPCYFLCNTTEQKAQTSANGGIGLANVQQRLALLYPGKHQLNLKQEDGWFGVELNLLLHQ
jgi:sensor histidine kinase YesM